MSLYRFQIQSDLTTQAVVKRIRALVREKPGFRQSLKKSFGLRPDGAPPFIGRVKAASSSATGIFDTGTRFYRA